MHDSQPGFREWKVCIWSVGKLLLSEWINGFYIGKTNKLFSLIDPRRDLFYSVVRCELLKPFFYKQLVSKSNYSKLYNFSLFKIASFAYFLFSRIYFNIQS